MDNSHLHPGRPPGGATEGYDFSMRVGGGIGTQHPWPPQQGHWPPPQHLYPPLPPPQHPPPSPHLYHPHPPPHPPPSPFHHNTPPPPLYPGQQQQQQQAGPWPHPSSRGQQPPVSDQRGHFDQGATFGPYTNFGPGPPHQPRLQPASGSERFWPSQNKGNGNTAPVPAKVDEDARQREQDEEWIKSFLQRKGKRPSPAVPAPAPTASKVSVFEYRQKLSRAVQMLSELSVLCQTLKHNLENKSVWIESFSRATELKHDLQERVPALQDKELVSRVKKKLEQIKKKRVRMRRRKAERMEEKIEEERRAAEREAAIDKYRMKKIQELEEKDRERELKLAADAVLSEVRKKQSDSKRMLDILKALEKLRKLRKEAASRKGMFPEKQCDEVFEGHLTRLRSLIRKRTAVYGAEEKALRVMLEGEQEEERKRDREKRLKKEAEKLMLKKKEINTMLFGAELPPDHPLQAFQEYYTQAERSLPALIQIRREWDQFLVPVDHPDGTSVPQGWVLPDPPADDVWATALEK